MIKILFSYSDSLLIDPFSFLKLASSFLKVILCFLSIYISFISELSKGTICSSTSLEQIWFFYWFLNIYPMFSIIENSWFTFPFGLKKLLFIDVRHSVFEKLCYNSLACIFRGLFFYFLESLNLGLDSFLYNSLGCFTFSILLPWRGWLAVSYTHLTLPTIYSV